MKALRQGDSALVYSTETGRVCPQCRQPVAQCVCGAPPPRPAGDGVVRVSREVQGRKGKVVTVVRGLPGSDAEVVLIAKQLKAACGAGGTCHDGVVEIQGEHRDRLVQWLQQAGHQVKRVGG